MPRLLLGPYDDPDLVDRFLQPSIQSGDWRTFGVATPSWEAAIAEGGVPDALVVNPAYTVPPEWVWSAPVPVVALAVDGNLLWHTEVRTLALADLILTDAPAAERFRRAGLEHVRAANLYGLDRHFAGMLDMPEAERDIDLLFVGNVGPVQRERLPWLGRIAALSGSCKVVIAGGVFGEEYRTLMGRAKLVFNRSIRGECNLRALEAAACGAVLLQEAENEEVKEYLEPGCEYATYTAANLEDVVGRLLGNEEDRCAIAGAAKDRVRWWTFEALLRVGMAVGGKGWDEVKERARERRKKNGAVPLAGRVWQRASAATAASDAQLTAALTAAKDHHALGVLAKTPAEAERHFAAATGNRVSQVARAVALADLGRRDEAVAACGEAINALEATPELTEAEADSVPYPVRFDWLRVGWERAGYDHAGDPAAERKEKARLLRACALSLRGQWGRGEADLRAAVDTCPEWPNLRAALGAALLAGGEPAGAVEHLRSAVEMNPFDNASAQSLVEALVAAREPGEAERVSVHRQLLARSAPRLVAEIQPIRVAPKPPLTPQPAEPVAVPAPRHAEEHSPAAAPASVAEVLAPAVTLPPQASASAPAHTRDVPTPRPAPPSRFVDLSRENFAARFGSLEMSAAFPESFPPADAHTLLTLLAFSRPHRVLAVGAPAEVTDHFTLMTPAEAVVYALGNRAAEQGPAHDCFGTGHKAMRIDADPGSYNFARLTPLDFAFVAGGRDADAVAAYHALRPGGALAWRDDPGTAAITFPEPVYRAAGTGLAFLFKGEGLGAAAGERSGAVAVTWDGAVDALHSLAHVNRSLCAELVARGHDVALAPQPPSVVPAAPLPVPQELASLTRKALNGAVHVRHRWPPDFSPPAEAGAFVVIQPWEFGRVPRAWVESIIQNVDELWVPSRAVLRAFAASGVPESRIVVIPNGVDPDCFRPGLEPLALHTEKKVKLLFVGGTIPRKGFDVLLTAYRRAFTRADDVCLVVKDMGVGTFYRGQTAEEFVRALQSDPDAPEVLYLPGDLSEDELPRLYAACDALTHPYRGEGFGLPVLEAMACGLPVVVTAGGPTDEFVPQSACWRVRAKLRYFEREAIGESPTAGRPWWLEPDPNALVAILKDVVADADARNRRGESAWRAALGYTWARAASAVEDRVRVLRTRTPVRFARRADAPPAPRPVAPARVETLAAPASFAPAVTLRADEPIIVTTATAAAPRAAIPAVLGRPRVSLTMIVKNEEKNLPDCLASVRDLVDEAVVIDTGSTDRTRDVALRFGCKLGEFPWVDHFAAARNAALDHATGDYAFWMDADDRLDEENRRKLRALFDSLPAGNAAYVMKCLCVGEGAGAATTAVDHVRLFRLHAEHRWSYRVHEQILPALRATGADVQWSEVAVRHVGYVDPSVRRRKLDRDLRLLRLDEAERPDDPFTLFNLGSVYHELAQFGDAAGALERSLAGSHIKDSIVRKAYALLARCHHGAGDNRKAEATCRKGRTHYPDDAELLFLSAGIAREGGDPRAAEGLYRRLIEGSEGPHFASVDTSLRAVKGRHNLAVMLLDEGRLPEAEALWRAALSHDPHFFPAQVGLGEASVKAGNAPGVERQVAALEALGATGAAEAAVLSARWKASRGDHAGAVAVLEEAVARMPGALGVRVALSHIHIAADSPPEKLEPAFRSILELDPHNDQARRNLEVLYRKTGRWLEGVIDGAGPTPPA